jgi:flavin-dependent dehydrogenase
MTSDVVVVGGGPAGTATAIAACNAGLRVLLLERDLVPGERPGESVHPGIEPLLDRLGALPDVLSAGFLRHDGHWSTWGGPRRFVPFGGDERGPWRGFQLWRPTFDRLMLERAGRAGARVIRPCRDVRPLVDGETVVGVEWLGGVTRAPFVVDATGPRRWLARALGLPVQREGPRRVAWFGYGRGACPAADAAPSIVADASGWTWTARVQPDVYQWVRLPWDGARPARDWEPHELEGLARLRPTRGADVTWSCVRPCAGAGFFLAGDAAVILDPSSSHGVLRALMSGIAVADRIASILRGACPDAEARAYDAWLRGWFVHDVKRSWEAYEAVGVSRRG